MIRLHIIVEGPTGETFVRELLAPALLTHNVYASDPTVMGGDVRYSRVKKDILLRMKGDPSAYCTTFLDYYGLGPGFVAKETLGKFDSSLKKKQTLEDALFRDIARELGERYNHARFIPYFQMHEFEGLLFSDPELLALELARPELAGAFRAIREQFSTPEDINDHRATAPSKRILALEPGYNKPVAGNLAAIGIGLASIRSSCPLFDAWVSRLERLAESER